MTRRTCERCSTTYDTERDVKMPGADTTRCPSCGQKPSPDEEAEGAQAATDGGTPTTTSGGAENGVTVATDDGRLVVEIHIHVHND